MATYQIHEELELAPYRLPAGPLGDMAHRIFVQKQLKGIFRYREQVLEQ